MDDQSGESEEEEVMGEGIGHNGPLRTDRPLSLCRPS